MTIVFPWSEVIIISVSQVANSFKQSSSHEFWNQFNIDCLYADSFGISSFNISDSDVEWPKISTKLTTTV